MGKGSDRRPSQIEKSEFNENWDKIFSNEKVDKAVVEALKERSRQSTTSVIRNTKLDKSIVQKSIRRLRDQGVVVASGSAGHSNGHTWSLARNENSPEYKMATKKWTRHLFD
jgi:predicted transcriptional regulator